MQKIDFKKDLATYQAKHDQFSVIEVPSLQYLMVDGHGNPNTSEEFSDAVEALYPVAYKLKFMSKLEIDRDYVVPPLEGLWWAEDMKTFTTARDKSHWDWTMMIMTPAWITQEMFNRAKVMVAEKSAPSSLDKVRFQILEEGKSVQTLHIGSYEDEGLVLDRMHNEFIPSNGFKMVKKHHEIYLSDFRKVPAGKLRTILRQPVMVA